MFAEDDRGAAGESAAALSLDVAAAAQFRIDVEAKRAGTVEAMKRWARSRDEHRKEAQARSNTDA
jgi:hypothetical protein